MNGKMLSQATLCVMAFVRVFLVQVLFLSTGPKLSEALLVLPNSAFKYKADMTKEPFILHMYKFMPSLLWTSLITLPFKIHYNNKKIGTFLGPACVIWMHNI